MSATIDVQPPGKLIRLADVPRKIAWLADGPKGEPVSAQTVFVWSTRGVRGIRLRTWSQGGTRVTTEQWLIDFFRKLSLEVPTVADQSGPLVAAGA